jgi:hypothetical protein
MAMRADYSRDLIGGTLCLALLPIKAGHGCPEALGARAVQPH